MNRFLYILGLFLIVSSCATTTISDAGYDESNYTLHYSVGLTHLERSEPSFALEDFLKAEKYKKTPELYYSMGWACYMMGLDRYSLAVTYFDKSLSLDRNFSSSNVGKGIVYRETERYEEALAEFGKALDNILFHEPETAYFNIALTYLAMKDLESAVPYLKSAIQLRADYLPAYYQLALVYMDLRSYEAAQDAARRILTYAPDSAEAHLLLGKVYLKLGKETSAVTEFKEVIRLAPGSDYAREAQDYLMGGDN